MTVKRFFLIMAAAMLFTAMPASAAEPTPRPGQIALIPYLPETYPSQVEPLLRNKLMQMATENGMAGAGFDDRFIITAHVQPIAQEQTATIPAKTAIRLSVTLYVGDGIDGTLYAQHEAEVRGIGSNESQAWQNALRRLQPRDAQIQAFVEKGRQRIVDYYDRMAQTIITKAKTLAKSTQYDEAIATLLTIPAASKAYGEAQQLIAQYGQPAIENANRQLLAKANAAWSAQPNEDGAAKARALLAQVSYPTKDIEARMRELCQKMATALDKQQDQEWLMLMQEQQNWHERELKRIEGYNQQQVARIESEGMQRVASIMAAAEVEKAWINRPRVVYHVNWW